MWLADNKSSGFGEIISLPSRGEAVKIWSINVPWETLPSFLYKRQLHAAFHCDSTHILISPLPSPTHILILPLPSSAISRFHQGTRTNKHRPIILKMAAPLSNIRLAENRKLITTTGEFWVDGKLLGKGKWENRTRFTVFVSTWGDWWSASLPRAAC